MINRKMASLALAALLVPGAVACDREDKRDVKEVGRDVEEKVDKLDKDGKDD